MTPIYLNNYKSLVEQAIMQVLQLAFQRRITPSPAADLTALANLDVTALADGDLCFVTSQSTCYQYARFSGAAIASPQVIAPAVQPTAYPGARWIAASIPATYGPNWRAPLLAQGTGTLRAVVLYAGDGNEDEKFVRLMAATPSLMFEHREDRVQPLSAGYLGSHYRVDSLYTCTIFSDNSRASPWSSWGSPASLSETSDPGPAAIIGELRRVCAGLTGADLGLGDTSADGVGGSVERVEIGDSRLVDEKYAERFLVWEADLHIRCYVWNPDLDLDPMLLLVQPNLTDSPPPTRVFWEDMASLAEHQAVKYVLQNFDPLNYVASGLNVPVPSPGSLTSTPVSGTAMISGASVGVTGAAHTFPASSDIYRDLSAAGAWTYLAVPSGAPPPALTAGCLRVGLTTTSATAITSDRYLCSYSQAFRSPYQILP